MAKKSRKRIPQNWLAEIEYLEENFFFPGNLKPKPSKNLPLLNNNPSHPFTSSPLSTICLSPPLPSPFVKIISLKDQICHPASPGSGLFAKRDLKERELIVCYTGKVTRRMESEEKSNYLLGFGKEICIDGWKQGSEARFINDYRGIASKPNASFHEFIDAKTGELKMGVWVMPGVGKIKKGNEILVSYGKGFWRERSFLLDGEKNVRIN